MAELGDERYLLRLIEEAVSKKIHNQQIASQTMLKADNGEFMNLTSVTNIENVGKSVATWGKEEQYIEFLRLKHDPAPPVPPPKPVPPTPPEVPAAP